VNLLTPRKYTVFEIVNLLTHRKYTILNGHFVSHFHHVFQGRNSDVKRDLPVFYIFTGSWWPDLLDSVEGLCSVELVWH